MPPATSSGQALTQLQEAQASQLTPDQAQQSANKALGVDQAQQTVTGLRGAIQRTTSLLQNVAPSVYGRTGGSLVTTAQAGRQIQNESAPIQQDLAKNNQDYSNANADYQDLEHKAENQANNNITAQNGRLSFLQSIYGDLYGKEQDQLKAQQAAEAAAEQKRQFDVQMAETRAARAASAAKSAGSYATPTFGGGSASTGASSGGGYQVGHDKSGGWQIADASGHPLTLGQYVAAQGGTANDVLSYLNRGSAGDKAIAANISRVLSGGKYTWATLQPYLVKDYPQVFGG